MRAFDSSLRPAKSEVHHGRGGWQGGRGRRGPPGRRNPPDDQQELRYKLTKLGDYSERLITAVKDVARLIDAFLAPEASRWLLPELGTVGEEDNVDLLHKALLASPWVPEGSHSAFLLQLMCDCIMNLPHKHSYYAALWWIVLQEARGQSDLNTLLQNAYGLGGAKDELVMVKGELMEDGEPSSPQPPPAAAKYEQGTKRNIPTQEREQGLRYVHLFGALVHRLRSEIEQIFRGEGGLHKLHLASNAFRFLADCVNLTLMDPVTYINMAQGLLTAAQTAPPQISDIYMEFGICNLLWLNRSIYQAHQDLFAAAAQAVTALGEARAARSRAQVRASHPLINFEGVKGYQLSLQSSHDLVDALCIAFHASLGRGWVSKTIPRLYESPKLGEYRDKPLLLRMKVDIDCSIDPETFATFKTDLETLAREEEIRKPKPVQLYQAPMSWLFWKRANRPAIPLCLFTDSDISAVLDVEPLGPADVCVTRTYIHSTLAVYFQDPDLCAEQLMGLPIKHDQFLYILAEEIFSTCLAPPYSPLATMGYTRLAAVFMTQLLHRLCILERSLIPIITRAFTNLIKTVSCWDELTFHQMVAFTAHWVSADEKYSREIMGVLSQCPDISETALRFKPEAETIEEGESGESRDVKFSPSQVTRIGTPLAEISCLKSHSLRFLAHLAAKMRVVMPGEMLETRLPPELHFVLFEEASLEDELRFNDPGPDTRVPDDIAEMRNLNLSEMSCLEATMLRRLLRLQVTGKRECQVVVAEALAFLQSRVGQPFLRDITEYSRDFVDRLLFPPTVKSLKRDAPRVKAAPGEDGESGAEEPSSKRMRNDAGQQVAPVVKIEATEINDTDEQQQQPPAPAAMSEGPNRVKEEMSEEPTENNSPFVDSGARKILEIPFLCFEGAAAAAFVWTRETLTKLLANVLVCSGSRTLSHSQKVLDLYVPLLSKWRELLLAETAAEPTPEARDQIRQHVDTVLVNTISEAWIRASAPRFKFVLQQFMTHDAVTPENLLNTLLQHNGDQIPFVCTVIGDSLFADILETIVGLISSDVPSRTAFASMQLKELEDEGGTVPSQFVPTSASERQQQLARVYAVALRKIAGTCERALSLEKTSQTQSLTVTIALNKLARLLKDAIHAGAHTVVNELMAQAQHVWPELTAVLPQLGADVLSVMHEGAVIWQSGYSG